MLRYLRRKIVRARRAKELRKRFPDSDIDPFASLTGTTLEGANVVGAQTNLNGSFVGYASVIGYETRLPNCRIGRFCSISWGVSVSPATHPLDMVSTYPGFFATVNNYPFGKGTIKKTEFLRTPNGFDAEIGNDVWIGEGALIKGGVVIGDGAVIGMRAVVTKDVPPYAIVGGVPAKIIRYRTTEDNIKKLLSIKWWEWPKDFIRENRESFGDVDKFCSAFCDPAAPSGAD